MLSALRFLFSATRGHRLRPWRSPYLRWRLETYSGIRAGDVTARDFLRLIVTDRVQLLKFLRWLSEMKHHASRPEGS